MNGRKSCIIPAIHKLLLNEPVQFTLGEHSVDEVDLAVGHDMDVAQTQGASDPLELLIAAGEDKTRDEVRRDEIGRCYVRESARKKTCNEREERELE